ncbi:hypothetical protein EYF80_007406 [Liparis tanakae]|uniref:Uncharacterized protein n=1 Tax=Liparis tanakae TaxID=230148 RepID=A0A4Z2IWE3_9TELE|nr:hypothetical protein EYF80_007406 [Liparis tanakae]
MLKGLKAGRKREDERALNREKRSVVDFTTTGPIHRSSELTLSHRSPWPGSTNPVKLHCTADKRQERVPQRSHLKIELTLACGHSTSQELYPRSALRFSPGPAGERLNLQPRFSYDSLPLEPGGGGIQAKKRESCCTTAGRYQSKSTRRADAEQIVRERERRVPAACTEVQACSVINGRGRAPLIVVPDTGTRPQTKPDRAGAGCRAQSPQQSARVLLWGVSEEREVTGYLAMTVEESSGETQASDQLWEAEGTIEGWEYDCDGIKPEKQRGYNGIALGKTSPLLRWGSERFSKG